MGPFVDWQVAVETAQVVAGLVDYPPGNPFYIYHTKLWSVVHQILAVFLAAGVSERTLSIGVSGLLGMVSFQALSLIVYGLSRDLAVALGAAALIFFSRVAEAGAVYPIWLVGTPHTYGVLGLGYLALFAGFVGAGWRRTGLFLLGAAPAVHPSLGAWAILIAAGVFVWDFRHLSRELRPALPAFLAGCALTGASLAVQLTLIYDVPQVDPSVTDRYLAAFVAFWDMHRQRVDLQSDAVKLNIAALVIGALWLFRFADDVPGPARFLLRLVVVSAALGLVLAGVSWIPPDRLPPWLLILMPARLLNFNVLIFGAVLLGIIGAYRRTRWGGPLMLLMVMALMLGARSGLWSFAGAHEGIAGRIPGVVRPDSTSSVVFVGGLLVVAALMAGWRRAGLTARAGEVARRQRPAALVVRTASLAVIAAAAALTWTLPVPRGFGLLDRTNDQLFRMVSEGEGLLMTGGDLHLIQLRTRRPVLLDGGGLDALPYAIESAPEMERMLRDVYSVDLLHPPEEARYRGTLPHEFVKHVWEGYPLERWQRIAETYGARQVLTSGDWDLKLPVLVRGRTLTVYDIPDLSP